jgi:hypothetical protein
VCDESGEDVEVPVPESEIFSGEFGALLAIESVPVSLPAAFGSKFTVYCTDWFGVSVSAAPDPLRLNPVPLTVTPVIFAFALPVLVIVTDCVDALPDFTLPKLKLVVLADSATLDETPLPLSGIEAELLVALLSIVIEPLSVAALVGLNSAVNVALLPAPSE